MGKGMSLEEFRTVLSSDATIENEKLKAELKTLKEKSETEIAELKEKSEQYEQWCKQLGRRCFVQTCGAMCMNCSVECCDYAIIPAVLLQHIFHNCFYSFFFTTFLKKSWFQPL